MIGEIRVTWFSVERIFTGYFVISRYCESLVRKNELVKNCSVRFGNVMFRQTQGTIQQCLVRKIFVIAVFNTIDKSSYSNVHVYA